MLTRLMNPQQFGSVPPDIGIRLIGKSGFESHITFGWG